MLFHKSHPLKGEITVPGDKSISHRGIMLGALANGTTSITNFLKGADCLSTISCFQKMGIEIEETENEILVYGKGLHGLSASKRNFRCRKQWYNDKINFRYFSRTKVFLRPYR